MVKPLLMLSDDHGRASVCRRDQFGRLFPALTGEVHPMRAHPTMVRRIFHPFARLDWHHRSGPSEGVIHDVEIANHRKKEGVMDANPVRDRTLNHRDDSAAHDRHD